ncbi:MAG: hypothetical protein JO219_11790 [Candidatus Eremiobacteraeota bacterium]|nr:hypothetical protein [Candidatus Eremiobacteraeota bacterium]MBV8367141.1 hypothetical protein [Candidatus Eremiobacteraeota bacterium]
MKRKLAGRPGRVAIWVLLLAAAGGLFVLAVSDSVYDATSPGTLPHHVIVRKLYSLVCFTLLGLLFGRSLGPSSLVACVARASAAVGAYSTLVEIGQHLAGSHESIKWNLVDICIGAVGGALGGAIDWLWSAVRAPAKHL